MPAIPTGSSEKRTVRRGGCDDDEDVDGMSIGGAELGKGGEVVAELDADPNDPFVPVEVADPLDNQDRRDM